MLILITMGLAFGWAIDIVRKANQIRRLAESRDEARKLALAANDICRVAINKASNRKEIIEFFDEKIKTGILIGDSPGGFDDIPGMTKEECLMRIYVLTEIMKGVEE